MIGFMFKVVVGGVAMYGVSKFLERTQVLEKVVATGTEKVDQILTKVNQAYEQQETNVNGSAQR